MKNLEVKVEQVCDLPIGTRFRVLYRDEEGRLSVSDDIYVKTSPLYSYRQEDRERRVILAVVPDDMAVRCL